MVHVSSDSGIVRGLEERVHCGPTPRHDAVGPGETVRASFIHAQTVGVASWSLTSFFLLAMALV